MSFPSNLSLQIASLKLIKTKETHHAFVESYGDDASRYIRLQLVLLKTGLWFLLFPAVTEQQVCPVKLRARIGRRSVWVDPFQPFPMKRYNANAQIDWPNYWQTILDIISDAEQYRKRASSYR